MRVVAPEKFTVQHGKWKMVPTGRVLSSKRPCPTSRIVGGRALVACFFGTMGGHEDLCTP